MIRSFSVAFLFIAGSIRAFAQDDSTLPPSGSEYKISAMRTRISDDVLLRAVVPGATVHAFNLERTARTAPVSIGIVDQDLLRRYGNTSIVQAVNTIPGVRMEERSPGSYRLAIRGSSLRAPFGVRNMKIYYNGIPFTDPGGGTYLNELGYYNISRMEIVKGPGASLYGAGTGGVMLIESLPTPFRRGFGMEATSGSYGLINLEAEARTKDNNGSLESIVRYQHLTSDGYREHSAFRRDVLSWDAHARLDAGTTLSTSLFFTDLYYETPGALTLAEYEADPRGARPAAGPVPGATEAGASVGQKAFLSGITMNHFVNEHWSFATTLYGAFTALENPTLRNYGRSNEPHGGGRAFLKYRSPLRNGNIAWMVGAEAQQGLAGVQVYSIKAAAPDTLQTDDKLHIRSAFAFTQATLSWKKWVITSGVSVNAYRVRYVRLTNSPYTEMVRDFSNEAAPRLAIGYSFNDRMSLYSSVSRGFSPPTSAELSPTGSSLNNDLNAESGWNYEAGAKGVALRRRLRYELTAFWFGLSNTIVQRRDAAGGDYFVNSGGANETGIEAGLWYEAFGNRSSRYGMVSVFATYSYQHFRYTDFRQLDQDFSGNALPGVAPHTVAAGIDWESRFGLYARLSYFYSAAIPLNDAGTAMLDNYQLLGARIGYKIPNISPYGIEVFAGGDNLGDVRYSAGPDINGFGGRYYNAAARRGFYAGVALQRAR